MATFKAIALCRVSTSKQRLEGSSLQAQETRVNECADYLSVTIKQLWSLDTSSRKGKNLARKDLNEMYEYCRHDKSVKYIIVDEADRFMRSMEEAYWWKVQFKMINVRLAYANMPEITHEDNPMAVMREMMAFFQAEVSNHERITKTTDKMQAKIMAGYYPGMVHQGYCTSDVPSLHVPREPQWSLLKSAMNKVLYEAYSMSDALSWLNSNGYRLQGGGLLDMHKLRHIFKQPYYAGIVKMSDWPVIRKNALHKAMITEEEHERLIDIVAGKRKKFTVNKFNPLFPASNIVECADCKVEQKKDTKLVGYRHHNGKPERTRKFYERYRCRGCSQNNLKSVVHSEISKILSKTQLIVDDEKFKESMRKVWRDDVAGSIDEVRRLRQKITMLTLEKDNLVRSMASNLSLSDDFASSINVIKSEITAVKADLASAEDIEEDFEAFMSYSLDYINHLKDNWWNADSVDDRIRLKELLYIDGLQISRTGKVLTPQLSPIYRYKTSKKTSKDVILSNNISTGGPGGT